MPLMPAFHRRKQNAASVGRLVTGYGELEFLLAWCAGTALACEIPINHGKTAAQHRIAGEHEGVRRIFSIRGETNRIDAAKRLIRPAALKAGMQNDYIELMASFKSCLRIRNSFAHCNWHLSKKRGLFFVDLEEAAKSGSVFPLKQRHADTKTLEMIEQYFVYVFHCLHYLSATLAIKNGLLRGPLPTKPRRLGPLPSNPVLFPYKNPH
jgi:hypothetical protein